MLSPKVTRADRGTIPTTHDSFIDDLPCTAPMEAVVRGLVVASLLAVPVLTRGNEKR